MDEDDGAGNGRRESSEDEEEDDDDDDDEEDDEPSLSSFSFFTGVGPFAHEPAHAAVNLPTAAPKTSVATPSFPPNVFPRTPTTRLLQP
jgi:hypothetical protein